MLLKGKTVRKIHLSMYLICVLDIRKSHSNSKQAAEVKIHLGEKQPIPFFVFCPE